MTQGKQSRHVYRGFHIFVSYYPGSDKPWWGVIVNRAWPDHMDHVFRRATEANALRAAKLAIDKHLPKE